VTAAAVLPVALDPDVPGALALPVAGAPDPATSLVLPAACDPDEARALLVSGHVTRRRWRHADVDLGVGGRGVTGDNGDGESNR
jgi:hypothetical protein